MAGFCILQIKMKIFKDTLQNEEGKYSRKSLTAFVALVLSVGYEFLLPWFDVPTKEYVFITLITLTGSTLGLTVWDKKRKS